MTALKSNTNPSTTGIEARCAATGMRMTEQRRVIARVLAEAADHPDVEELYRRCVAVDDKISISTVYRTVKLFEDAGIIERHDFREGRARYEQMRDSHHDHLINLRDGKVIEFTSEEIEKLQAEIARKLGYKLVDHRLELIACRWTTTNLICAATHSISSFSIATACWSTARSFPAAPCGGSEPHGYPITPTRCSIAFSAFDREATISRSELGRSFRTISSPDRRPACNLCSRSRHPLSAMRSRDHLPMRGIERHAGEDSSRPDLRA